MSQRKMRNHLATAILLCSAVLVPGGTKLQAFATGSGNDPLAAAGRLIRSHQPKEARAALLPALENCRQKGDRETEAIALFFLGIIDSMEANPSATSANVEMSAKLFESQGEDFAAWFVLATLAEGEMDRWDCADAVAGHRKALDLLARSKASARPFSMSAFVRMSDLLGFQNNAAGILQAQADVFKPLLLMIAEANSRLSLGRSLVELGRLDEADHELSRVGELSSFFNGMFEAPLSLQLGSLRRRQWRLDEARESYKRALRAAEPGPGRSRNENLELSSLESLEEIEELSGRIDDALAWNDKAAGIARRRGDRAMEACSLDHRGRILMAGQRFDAAEKTFSMALDVARSAEHKALEGLIHKDLAFLDLTRGRDGRAVTHLETAAVLFRAENLSQAELMTRVLLATAYYRIGSESVAGSVTEEAEHVAADREEKNLVGLVDALGRFLQNPGDSSEIESLSAQLSKGDEDGLIPWNLIKTCFKATSALANSGPPMELPDIPLSTGGDAAATGYAYWTLGLVHLQRGNLGSAREMWTKALAVTPDRERNADILIALGTSYWREGSYKEAFPYFVRAVEAIELAGQDMAEGELLSGFMGNHRQAAYHFVIEALIEQGRFDEAFDYAERSRARAFLQDLGSRDVASRTGGDPALTSEIEALRIKIVEWEQKSLFLPPRESARVAEDLAQARRRYASLLARLKISRRSAIRPRAPG